MEKNKEIKKPSKDPLDRINGIINNEEYQDWIVANNQAEYGSEYCRHGLEHALDVARISYELWLDNQGNPLAKDIVYAAGLLHDIGFWSKFENIDEHDDCDCGCHEHHNHEHEKNAEPETPFQVGASLAEDILFDAGYHPAVIAEITKAIINMETDAKEGLSVVLRKANELSRPCFVCPMKNKCDKNNKNLRLVY